MTGIIISSHTEMSVNRSAGQASQLIHTASSSTSRSSKKDGQIGLLFQIQASKLAVDGDDTIDDGCFSCSWSTRQDKDFLCDSVENGLLLNLIIVDA